MVRKQADKATEAVTEMIRAWILDEKYKKKRTWAAIGTDCVRIFVENYHRNCGDVLFLTESQPRV